jgi:hypothetical protein
LKLVTIINYSANANSHTLYSSPEHALSLLSLLGLHRLSPGNGSQRRRCLRFHVPRLRSSLAGAHQTTQLGVAWLQSSMKGYSSRPCGSRTALPNRLLKTVLLCPWSPSQGPGPPACPLTPNGNLGADRTEDTFSCSCYVVV